MADLLLVTSNPGKAHEVEAIIGRPVRHLALDLPEIQTLDVAEVARHKALEAFRRAEHAVVVEDTGLYIDALGGLPGALVKWFLEAVGPAGICALVPEFAIPTAVARTAVALCDGGRVVVYTGETRGVIVEEPVGDGGFGWDAIFRPDGSERTFAQMDAAERAVHSMRRQAFEHLAAW